MGYLLIQSDVLRKKGVENFETMPDGRAIVDFSMLRVLGSLSNVEIVSTADEMFAKIKEEEESGLYSKEPSEEIPQSDNTDSPHEGNSSVDSSAEDPSIQTESNPANGVYQEETVVNNEPINTEQVKEGGNL